MLTAPIQEPYDQALGVIPTEQLLLNRLTAPLVIACAAARSRSCVAPAARSMLGALLPALRRATVHWAEQNYSHPGNLHGPATARALAELAASGDTEPLTEYARALTTSADALASLLDDLATEFTYNDELRPSLTLTWRPLMAAVLTELEQDPRLLDDHGQGIALGSLLPAPDLRLADASPNATMKHAEQTWEAPDTFADLIGRWLPIAQGQPSATDGLARLARCGALTWQATTGLEWTETQIGGRYPAIARRSFQLPAWLADIRPHLPDDGEATPRWRRIIDGLAAGGDSRAARLQQAEE
jgi:hypothetical protein